jgi:ppGpp synthetase/RelA/SpoT-type nucleotidyltranferase
MTEKNDQFDELLSVFDRSKALYGSLVEEILFAVKKMLSEQTIKVATVIGRVKEHDSLADKLQRKNYRHLNEIPDIAATRIVTLFEPDSLRVAELIREHFIVVSEEEPKDKLGIDRMGYAAHHFVVTLGSQSYVGPRYEGLRDIPCEIQVRTAIQDAWSLVSHNLFYKQKETIPSQIHRQLNKVSALLEIAQDVFESVRESREVYVQEAQEKQNDPEVFHNLPVDSDTVIAYTRSLFPDLPISEKIHGLLMRDIDMTRYRVIGDLDKIVQKNLPTVKAYAKETPDLFRFGTDYITKALGLGDRDFRTRHPFGTKTRSFFDTKDKENT